MAEVKFTVQSINDLNEIAAYISNDSPFYAALFIEKLIARTDILVNFPKTGRIVPELNIKSIRELIEGNYRIIYRIVDKNLIHILTFYHSRRLLNKTEIKKTVKENK